MRHLRTLGHSLAAGALAGGVLAPMQLLCWPDLQLAPERAVLACLIWASWGAVWLGGGFFLVQEIGWFLAPAAGHSHYGAALWRRHTVAVSLLVAAVAWWNNAQTRELLVSANRQAITTAGWVALAVALALVVPLGRRAPRRHPYVAGVVAFGALLGSAWGIWIASAPAVAVVEAPVAIRTQRTPRLLFVSWEGADLAWLLPAMERGDMPFLAGIWRGGAWGQVRTIRPYARTAALATLLTGCAPAVHGVLGQRSFLLPWLADQPVTLLLAGPWPTPHQLPWWAWQRTAGLAPRRANIGQILAAAGATAASAGWPPSLASGDWVVSLPLAAVVPAYETLDAGLRAALDPALRERASVADFTRRAYAVASGSTRLVRTRLTERPVDVLALDNNLASRVRPPWTGEDPASPWEDVIRQATRLLDAELSGLWKQFDAADTLLVLASPYGLAEPTPLRRLGDLIRRNDRWRVSADESPDGFAFFYGPGVAPGARIRGARLADVTPTALYLLDLPVARDMAGRVLLDAVDPDRAAVAPLRQVATFPRPPGR